MGNGPGTDPSAVFDSPSFDPGAFLASLEYFDAGDLPVPPVLNEGEEVLVRRTYHLPASVDARLKETAERRGLTVEQLLDVLTADAA